MPNDAFGQHYATAFRFNDQVDQEELYEEALKYYANILTPFSPLVSKKIDEVLALEPARGHDRAEPRRHLAQGPPADREEVPGVGGPDAREKRRHPLRHHVGGHAPDGRGHRRRACRRGRALQAVPHGRHGPQRRDHGDLQGEGRRRRLPHGEPGPPADDHRRSWRTCGGFGSRTRSARPSAPTAGAASR